MKHKDKSKIPSTGGPFAFRSGLKHTAPGYFNPDDTGFPATKERSYETNGLGQPWVEPDFQPIETFNGRLRPGAFLYPEYIGKSDNTLLTGTGTHAGKGKIQSPRSGERPIQKNEAREFIKLVGPQNQLPRCSGVFIAGRCQGGHRHLKAVFCEKEWCPDCGRPDSMAHRRRLGRWWKKYETFETVGYLVVTVPRELRHEFKDKKALQDFRRYVRRKLQRTNLKGETAFKLVPYCYKTKEGKIRAGTRKKYSGYDRGFIRYHYAGDCKRCKGVGCLQCRYTGAGNEFNPHLNILLPEGHVNGKKLKEFRQDIANWFKNYFNLKAAPVGNIHYNYTRETERKIHRLKYVTRATQRLYVPEIAEVLHKFHTSASWGRFKQSFPSTVTEAGEANLCLHCLHRDGAAEPIKWGAKLTREEATVIIGSYQAEENGYYIAHDDIELLLRE